MRDLLLFRCGRPCGNEEGIAYAVNFQRDNCNTLSASASKALVTANVSPERIAHEFGTTKEKIETFEKLYFDARHYLKHRGWLRGICFPAAKPNAVVALELRWFAIAFGRGWPGVEEVVLGRVPKSGSVPWRVLLASSWVASRIIAPPWKPQGQSQAKGISKPWRRWGGSLAASRTSGKTR